MDERAANPSAKFVVTLRNEYWEGRLTDSAAAAAADDCSNWSNAGATRACGVVRQEHAEKTGVTLSARQCATLLSEAVLFRSRTQKTHLSYQDTEYKRDRCNVLLKNTLNRRSEHITDIGVLN